MIVLPAISEQINLSLCCLDFEIGRRWLIPLIQDSRDLVQLFVKSETAWALVRRVAGIFVNVDR